MKPAHYPQIRRLLSAWYDDRARDLPWRRTRDPYRIWLSEIILQQTRVEQGLPYYEKFIRRFPDIRALAQAHADEIKKLWEGLGYYRRADNMHATAKIIAEQYGGRFPASPEALKKLPGIGDYTAAAVASFAFDIPVAVTDGNVMRVLSRLSGWDAPVNTPAGQKIFRELAEELLDKNNPAKFNQSLMEFGALQCVPRNPRCEICPLQDFCAAYQTGNVNRLPVKKTKKPLRKRYFYYFLSEKDGKVAVRQRTADDIWRGLYEFPGWESDRPLSVAEMQDRATRSGIRLRTERPFQSVRRTLTHQRLTLEFWETEGALPAAEYVDFKTLSSLPFPVALRKILDDWINMPNFEP